MRRKGLGVAARIAHALPWCLRRCYVAWRFRSWPPDSARVLDVRPPTKADLDWLRTVAWRRDSLHPETP